MTYSTDPDYIEDVQTELMIEAMWRLIEVQEFQDQMLKSIKPTES